MSRKMEITADLQQNQAVGQSLTTKAISLVSCH